MAVRPIKRKPKMRLKWLNIIVLLVFGYVMYQFVYQYQMGSTISHQSETLKARLGVLRAANEQLQQERDLLQTPGYIEKIAREELGMVKNGETVFMPGEQVKRP